MAIYKNPFLTRFADRAGVKNSNFLSMYAPEIIKTILNTEELLIPKASWFIGIPGSGKSSILRLFSVEILNEIIKQRTLYLHLYEPLVDAKIIIDDEIKTVGIYVQIDELFTETANVNLPNINNEQLFYTLFDLRIAKQILVVLKGINKNSDSLSLDKLFVEGVSSDRLPPNIFSEKINLNEFSVLIREQEQMISQVLSSFPGKSVPESLELHNRFSSLDLINAQGKFHNIQFVLMVDDVHDLYPEQLKLLRSALVKRNSFPRWLASRKHILPISTLIGNSTGFIDERELHVVDIDQFSKNRTLYKKFIKNLVEKRLKLTSSLSEFTIEQIEGMLSSIDFENYFNEEAVRDIQQVQREELLKLQRNNRFSCESINDFVDKKRNFNLLEAELLLIKANRFIKKRQPSLFPELEIDIDGSATKDKQAAELFIKKRAKVPLYSGFDTILDASNHNVEQYLRVFSPFVDRLIFRVELDKDINIIPKDQCSILQKAAKSYMDDMISKLLYGKSIHQLVDNLGRYFAYRTYEPNAPHAPGVTQFAITAEDMAVISNHQDLMDKSWVSDIVRTLSIAISNNVIVPQSSTSQGAKGSAKKYVFSLNRLLCVKFELPLQRGDFQLFSLDFLSKLSIQRFTESEMKSRKLNRQKNIWG